jgi:hypothetical protein
LCAAHYNNYGKNWGRKWGCDNSYTAPGFMHSGFTRKPYSPLTTVVPTTDDANTEGWIFYCLNGVNTKVVHLFTHVDAAGLAWVAPYQLYYTSGGTQVIPTGDAWNIQGKRAAYVPKYATNINGVGFGMHQLKYATTPGPTSSGVVTGDLQETGLGTRLGTCSDARNVKFTGGTPVGEWFRAFECDGWSSATGNPIFFHKDTMPWMSPWWNGPLFHPVLAACKGSYTRRRDIEYVFYISIYVRVKDNIAYARYVYASYGQATTASASMPAVTEDTTKINWGSLSQQARPTTKHDAKVRNLAWKCEAASEGV